jgi:magnesium chelatase family protein
MTGLPGASVQDARDRIRPAVESSGLEWPLRRVVVNLSPGNLRKEGPGLDLPIAMGVLAASKQVPAGNLGAIRVRRVSSRSTEVSPRRQGSFRWRSPPPGDGLAGVVVPAANASEAGLVDDLDVVCRPPRCARWSPS